MEKMKLTHKIKLKLCGLLKEKTLTVVTPVQESVVNETIENKKIENTLGQYADLLWRNFLSGTNAIEIIRNSLLLSSQNLMLELSTIDELTQKNQLAQQRMEQLLHLVDLIEQQTGESSRYIEELLTVVNGIHENIDGIDRLSKQTNLVAINSAIESAHIGAKAAGFAVISQEIKQLSSEIQSQAKNITVLTQEINHHANNVNLSIDKNNQAIHSIHTAAKQSRELLVEVIESSIYMSEMIRFIATQEFLNTVKLDHIIWKIKVYELILQQDVTSTINSHTECRLGCWYYGELGRNYAHLNGFAQLEAPHANVHHSGQAALSAYRRGDDESLKSHLSTMEQASILVIKYIDELLDQLKYSLR